MFKRVLLLTGKSLVERLLPVLEPLGVQVQVIQSKAELLEASGNVTVGEDILICANSGVIVPEDVLHRLGGMAYNFHAAPPEFPGRDPHHFGVYRRAKRFGATAHVMTEKVDDGAIVGVEYVDIPGPDKATGMQLYALAQEAQLVLFARMVPLMLASDVLLPGIADTAWGDQKSTRAQFQKLCCVPADIDEEEMERRIRAFHVPGFENIHTVINGRVFRLKIEDK